MGYLSVIKQSFKNKSGLRNILFYLAVLIILYGAYKALFNVQEGAKRRRRNKREDGGRVRNEQKIQSVCG